MGPFVEISKEELDKISPFAYLHKTLSEYILTHVVPAESEEKVSKKFLQEFNDNGKSVTKRFYLNGDDQATIEAFLGQHSCTNGYKIGYIKASYGDPIVDIKYEWLDKLLSRISEKYRRTHYLHIDYVDIKFSPGKDRLGIAVYFYSYALRGDHDNYIALCDISDAECHRSGYLQRSGRLLEYTNIYKYNENYSFPHEATAAFLLWIIRKLDVLLDECKEKLSEVNAQRNDRYERDIDKNNRLTNEFNQYLKQSSTSDK